MSERQENRIEEIEGLRGSKKSGRTRFFGLILLVAAVVFWVAAPAVLLLPLSAEQKVWMGSAFLVLGEVAFWASAVVLGREVFRRYRSVLDPRRWFDEKPR
jgi:anti-sigma factor RsiW